MPNLAVVETPTPRIRPSLRSVPTSSSLTASSVTSNDIWTIWNGNYQTSATITGDATLIWTTWVRESTSTSGHLIIGSGVGAADRIQIGSDTTGTIRTPTMGATIAATAANNMVVWTNWVVTSNLSKEQEQVLLQRNEESTRRRLAMEAEQAKARERAEILLQESLDAKQREELAAKGYFELDVISRNGESRKYRIHRQWSHSIHQIDPASGRKLKTLCIHPREAVPVADSMLAQKLMLEGGMEEDLLRIANHS
jgi:hypothetical protein